jgi:hypothetical protein
MELGKKSKTKLLINKSMSTRARSFLRLRCRQRRCAVLPSLNASREQTAPNLLPFVKTKHWLAPAATVLHACLELETETLRCCCLIILTKLYMLLLLLLLLLLLSRGKLPLCQLPWRR